MKRKKTPRHHHTHTPAHLDTRKPIRIPTRTPELVGTTFNLRNNSLKKLKFLTRRRKRHGLRKNQLRVEKKSRPTDRTNVPQQTKNCTTSFVAHYLRHQETPKSVHVSGTSGPLPHVATEPRMGFRQELLDPLLHVTMEPSS